MDFQFPQKNETVHLFLKRGLMDVGKDEADVTRRRELLLIDLEYIHLVVLEFRIPDRGEGFPICGELDLDGLRSSVR